MRLIQPSLALLTLPLATLLGGAALADEIHLTDGKILSEVEVSTESLLAVEYRDGSAKEQVPSDQILRVVFSVKPPTVEAADAAAADGDVLIALDDLQGYIDGVIDKPQRRFPWAPAYAMYRLIEVQTMAGSADGVVNAAKQLIQHASDSRYVPLAYLAMAEALFAQEKEKDAQSALTELEGVVQSKSLSQRWQLELDLARAMYDSSLGADEQRTKLKAVSSEASGQYPTVRNRAEVAIGEAYLNAKNYHEALKIFEDIASDPKADDTTLAAAYTGLGESIFQIASATDDKSRLEEGLLSLLRVGVLYPSDRQYAPKAIFFAGLVSDLIGTEESMVRAQTLYRSLRRDYRDSTWAEQARGAIQR